jgi:endoglucanase
MFAPIALAVLQALANAPADSIAPDQTNMSTLSATDFAKGMTAGWNVGNSLEAGNTTNGAFVPSETSWGNPLISQALIDAVKAAGFNAIRLPVSWSLFTGDTSKFIIDTNRLARVQQVVDYAINDGLYVVMNEHWDGGWLQPLAADSAYCDRRLKAIWKQVAIRFRDYGDHLLFAGTNEVMVTNDYNAPTAENLASQNGFNQVFVSTVRSTGGRNAYRYLVVQGFNTNIAYSVTGFKTPKDPSSNRLFLEYHFYDPYDFTINTGNTTATEWGNSAPAAKTAGWGNETYVDTILARMKTTFGNKGIPMIMGEYGTILKNTSDNPQYRQYWTQYVTGDASKDGIVPFYWDNGSTGLQGMGLFDRNTGADLFPSIVQAIISQTPKPTSIRTEPASANGISAHLQAGVLSVDLAGGNSGTARLLDADGRIVVSGLPVLPGRNDQRVGRLRPGTYFLQIRTSRGTLQQAIACWN